ncbi:hypothetical protein EDM22_16460 [Agromyces tardus]|jgi:hypothetical protein|uniref:Integral membrane protein n=1 Tax=Agromyces tardus TaxID=2583849 RepID=A0A3M8A219_9MICO|nr:hypothetical protein [Agromyces tardus]RNB45263.1 hypothetical protein EDM22_16460 [Agromyces tardus]
MAETTSDDLQARIAQLEAENARLRETADLGIAGGGPPAASARRPGRGRGRAAAAIVLVLLGLLLAPVAVVSAWARLQLVDTDRFVATFAPLAEDPAVQAYLADEVTVAIDEKVDIDGLTKDVFDGLTSLDLPPRAVQALGLLEGPAAQGLHALLDRVVTQVVQSDAFAEVWAQALRVSHTQLIAALQGDPNAALAIGDDGTISVQLGPVIEAVKAKLAENGVAFASAIPVIEKSIVIAQTDSLTLIQTVYTLAVAAGTWVPLIALALLVAGVLVARRRSRALTWTAAGFALSMLLMLAGVGTAKLYFVGTLSPSIMPSGAAEAIYDDVLELMFSTIVALFVLSLSIAIIAWLSGTTRPALAVRGLADAGFGAVRHSAASRGVTTGAFGVWLDRWRVGVYAAIAVVASAVLWFSRPLQTSTVLWTVVLALLAVVLVQLLRRPAAEATPAEVAAAEGADVDAGSLDGPGPVGAEAVPVDAAPVEAVADEAARPAK